MGDTPRHPIGRVRLRQRLEPDTLAPPTHREPSESPPSGQQWQRVETRLLGALRLARRLAFFFGTEVADTTVLRLADMVLAEMRREPPTGLGPR